MVNWIDQIDRNGLDGVMEVFNSVAVVYFATEASLKWQRKWREARGSIAVQKRTTTDFIMSVKYQLAVVLIINVLFSVRSVHAVSLASSSLSHWFHAFQLAIDSCVLWLAHIPTKTLLVLGTDGLVAILTAVCTALIGFGFLVIWNIEPRKIHLLYVVSVGFGTYGLIKATEADISHWEASALKVSAVTTCFAVVCYYDSRRFRPELTITEFLKKVARSCAIVLPMVPFLAVLFATMFFFAVTVIEGLLGLNPHFLNMPIYYGTLYGPFCVVYFEVKRWCVHNQSSFLPLGQGA